MAHLTKPTQYNIADSNIALLGSDLEKHVREHGGDKEAAWQGAGKALGTQIWRIEKFHVVEWPAKSFGSFYDGDSYIVLHTYKKDPKAEDLSYDLHFWLGEETTQDEAGTAAYKTVELDDHLGGKPVQYRECQGFESPKFLSYFPKFVCMHGGVATGFHHISTPPPTNTRKLYKITISGKNLLVREVKDAASSLIEGDVFVLDKGKQIWQFNTKLSPGKEKFRAAEFVHNLVEDRRHQCEVTVFDEGGGSAGKFLSEFGADTRPINPPKKEADHPAVLYRVSDHSGPTPTFEPITPASRSSLVSSDAFLLDHSASTAHPAVYVWLGSTASLQEKRLAVQYAQKYIHDTVAGNPDESRKIHAALSVVKMNEGQESEGFLKALGG